LSGPWPLGAQCAFDFGVIAPKLPDFTVPAGYTEAGWLASWWRARHRPGTVRQAPSGWPGAYAQIARELDVIERPGIPGYFLIVHDIVEFCENESILCQGRGFGGQLGGVASRSDHQCRPGLAPPAVR